MVWRSFIFWAFVGVLVVRQNILTAAEQHDTLIRNGTNSVDVSLTDVPDSDHPTKVNETTTTQVTESEAPTPDISESTTTTTEIPFVNSRIVIEQIFYDGFPSTTWQIKTTVEDAVGIDIIVQSMDIDPATDTLKITPGTEMDNEKGVLMTGLLPNDEPKKIKIMQTAAFIEFKTTKKAKDPKFKGFTLQHSAYVRPTTPAPPPQTTPKPPPIQYNTTTVYLVVPPEEKTNTTWKQFVELLSESTNKYVAHHNMPLERANSTHVLSSIQNCPDSWLNYQACVKFRFGVALKYTNESDEMKAEQLTTEHLQQMWLEYGRDAFKFHEYEIPNIDYMLLIWSGIGLTIILVFLIVLYSIWKMDILRDYHLMSSRSDDRKRIISNQSEMDITMFPSPHQIVPTLFPSTSDPVQRLYGDESQPITFTISDFTANRESQRSDRGDGFKTIPETRLDMDDEEVVSFERKPIASPPSEVKQRMVLQRTSNNESKT